MALIEPFVFSDAVREFWATRERQALEQQERGDSDQGARGAVTGGQQMGGFINQITELMVKTGVNSSDIYTQRNVTHLPGFYRPTKGAGLPAAPGGLPKVARPGRGRRAAPAGELHGASGGSDGGSVPGRALEARGYDVHRRLTRARAQGGRRARLRGPLPSREEST